MKSAVKNNFHQIEELINLFITSFRSEHTKNAYKQDLIQFFTFCASQLETKLQDPSQITEGLCILWKHHNTHLANHTLARKIASLSSFFKFCERKKLIHVNPVTFLARPKTPQTGKTNILTKEEMERVLECAKNQIRFAEIHRRNYQHKLWTKRYTILYTLFTVGMRVEELCKLKYEDLEKIETNLYRLHLIAKGNQKHSPLIHSNTANVLLEYMEKFQINEKEKFIFDRMNRSSIYHIVKLAVKKANILKNVSPHSLRASLATHLHKIGVPIGHIKDLLNHKNIATTLLYTRVCDEELQANAALLE